MAEGLKTLIGRRISSVWADKPKVLSIAKKSEGGKILGVERKGKNIVLNLDKNFALLIHPKMTGRFLLNQRDKYERIIFNFEPLRSRTPKLRLGSPTPDFLTFSDKRRFAKGVLDTKQNIENIVNSIGEDALSISFEKFKNLINLKRGKINPHTKTFGVRVKQVLMDQSVVAGIGNIYADEILWKSKIHPERSSSSLSDSETQKIFKAMSVILKKSIKLRGVSIQDYRDVFGKMGEYQNHRLVYGRIGEKCKRCDAKIKKIKIAQRSAHFCPSCQSV